MLFLQRKICEGGG